jgi:hypothetical protein
MTLAAGEPDSKPEQLKKLICYVCESSDFRYDHCKVICLKCGCIVENCSGD